MKNLFNIDIKQIKHNGNVIILMKHNGDILYERERGFFIEYTVTSHDEYLNDKDISGEYCYGLPRIYSKDGSLFGETSEEKGTYSFNYSRLLITKKDGTTTSNPATKCNEIEKVRLWYPETTESLKFFYPFTDNGSSSPIKEVNYCNVSNFVSFYDMFHSCYGLRTINNVCEWGINKVTDLSYIFRDCELLTSIDLSYVDTKNVTDMSYMFSGCKRLPELDLSSFDMINVTNTNNMFSGCSALHTLRLDNCSNDTISKIISSSNFPTNVIEGTTKTIYCKGANASGIVAPINWVFNYIDEIVPEEPDIPEEPDTRPLYRIGQFIDNTKITEVDVLVDSTYTDISLMFKGCINLVSVNTQGWDTSNVTNMNQMFRNCYALTEIDLSSFNTSKLTTMYAMFNNCSLLETVNMSNWDMTNVNQEGNMANIFSNCTSLRELCLDNCSIDTISKIINSANFPTGTINGEKRKIYYKKADVSELTEPEGWEFVPVS